MEGQNEGSNKRKDYKTAVLDRRAQFDCSVKSTGSAENAAQVEIWWQFQDKNVTSHAISVTKEAGKSNIRLPQLFSEYIAQKAILNLIENY